MCWPSDENVAELHIKPEYTKQPSITRLRHSLSASKNSCEVPQPERLGNVALDVYEACGASGSSLLWEDGVTEAFVKGNRFYNFNCSVNEAGSLHAQHNAAIITKLTKKVIPLLAAVELRGREWVTTVSMIFSIRCARFSVV